MSTWSDPVRFRRRVVGVVSVAAGIGWVAGMAFDPPATESTHEAYLASLAANPSMVQVSGNLLWVAFIGSAVAVLGMLHLIRGRGVVLAHVGAILALPGLMTMSGMLITDYLDLALVQELGIESAVGVGAAVDAMPGMILFMVMAPLSSVGILLVAIGLLRSRVVPIALPIVLVVALGALFTSGGITLIAQIASVGLAIAYGWFGVVVLRTSDAVWAARDEAPMRGPRRGTALVDPIG